MSKVAKNLSAPIVSEIFEKRNNAYDLQNPFEFVLPKVHTVFRGIKSNSYFDPHVWNMVSLEMKKLTTISAFKRKVKKWKPENCPGRLCKPYIQSVSFVNAY